ARVFAAVDAMLASAQRAHDDLSVGQSELFGGTAARTPLALGQVEPWLPAERLQKEFAAIGFFLSGHPLDDYAAALKRMRVQSWAEFARAVRAGASAGRLARTLVARTERRTRTGSKMGIIELSDPTGHYEAVVFSEGLAQFRDLLEPGAAVLLMLSAELQGEDVRARIQMVEPLDQAAAKLARVLRVFLRDHAPIENGATRLESPAGATKDNGEVALVLMLGEGTEVEVKLPGRFKVSPQIAGAIKAVPGVVAVEAVEFVFRRATLPLDGRGRHPRRAGEESMKIVIVWLAAIVALLTPAHADNAVPPFQVDPFWPKPLPNNWILGQVSGIATDRYDRIWVVHRPGTLTARERAAEQSPPEAKCCIAAPPVLVFDQTGNLIRHWGGPGAGFQWPESEHGIFVDDADFVWLAGNGKKDGQLLKFTMDGKFVLQIGKQGEGNDSNST